MTVVESDWWTVKVSFKHELARLPYVDISLPDVAIKLIEEMRNLPAGQVCSSYIGLACGQLTSRVSDMVDMEPHHC